MKLVATKRTDYGIRALLYLAREPGLRIKAAEIAEAMDIPQGFLHQVLQELQRARLVDSRPSRHGGYRLARPPADVSLLDVVEALEGPLQPAECALRGGECLSGEPCVLHAVWSGANDALRRELASVDLDGLAAGDGWPSGGRSAAPEGAARPHPLLTAGTDGALDPFGASAGIHPRPVGVGRPR